MSRRWICNASPLILLDKIDRIRLLSELCDELIVPEIVLREVAVGEQGVALAEQLGSQPWISVATETNVTPDLVTWDLGPGETQVLALAVQTPGSRAVLDDLDGRRCARALGAPVIGTLGVVLRAKRRGIVPQARPVLDELRRVGLYVSDRLVETALAHLGE